MPGDRLTDEDRRHIAAGLAEGLGYTEIGRRLGRPGSTIMREVTRNGGPDNYRAQRAQEATQQRARRHRQAKPPAPPIGDSSHGRDPQAVQNVTESFATLLEQQGMPRMAARVLACLHVTDSGNLTAADLVQRLGVSPIRAHRHRCPQRAGGPTGCWQHAGRAWPPCDGPHDG